MRAACMPTFGPSAPCTGEGPGPGGPGPRPDGAPQGDGNGARAQRGPAGLADQVRCWGTTIVSRTADAGLWERMACAALRTQVKDCGSSSSIQALTSTVTQKARIVPEEAMACALPCSYVHTGPKAPATHQAGSDLHSAVEQRAQVSCQASRPYNAPLRSSGSVDGLA